METVKALRAEIALSLGYNDEAGYLLRDCQSDFSIAVEESSEPEMYRVFGESLANYTPAKTALLLKEAGMEDTADKSALPDEWKNAEARLGLLDHVETDRAGTGRGRMRSLRASHAFSAIRNKPFARAYAKSGILTTGKCGTRHGQFRPVGTV